MDEYDLRDNPDAMYYKNRADAFPINPTLQEAQAFINDWTMHGYLSHEQHLGILVAHLQHSPHQVRVNGDFLDVYDKIYHTIEGIESIRVELQQRMGCPVGVHQATTVDRIRDAEWIFTAYPPNLTRANKPITSKKKKNSKNKNNKAFRPPRPRNPWIILRQEESKKLKAIHPELSVQRICKFH
jgi:hypothetical protein